VKSLLANFLALAVAIGAPTLAAAAQQYDDAAEQRLFQLLNQERTRAGLPALEWDARLQRAARKHSQLMAQHRQLSHDFSGELPLSKRLAAQGIRLNSDAENVAFDQTAEHAHQGFMQSPPHRASIMNPQYNAGGIGVVRQGDRLWITEDFAHRLEDRTDQQAEDAIAAALERERGKAHLFAASRVRVPQLREIACSMAHKGRPDAHAPLGLPEVRSAVVYTAGEPERLPSSAVQSAHNPSVRRFAVAACFARNEQYPAGTYWVVITFY